MADAATAWTRQTPWRQGHVLAAEAVAACNLSYAPDPAATRVVVISHDCDIATDNLEVEESVEVIVGRSVPKEKANGNLFWGKSTRAILLDYTRKGESEYIELLATAKVAVSKRALANQVPDANLDLNREQRAALQGWLAARYRRSGFPDEFNKRMSESKLDDRLSTILDKEPYGECVTAVYFDVDGGREVDHSDGTAYELAIVLAYHPGVDPEASSAIADKVAAEISDEFAKRLFDEEKEVWKHIRLKGCVPIAEDELTVAKAKLLHERRLEHLTLRAPDKHSAPPLLSAPIEF